MAQTGYLYYANSPSLLTIQLPPLAIDQDRWSLINSGTATVRVSQAAGQVVVVGDTSTTAGVTGRITSYTQGDWIEFYYVSNKWYAEIKVGFVEVD